MDSSETPMTALEREVLEWVADRWRSARAAAVIADALDKPLPKVQAALSRLRGREAVAYFEGHPGSWAVTASGRAMVHLDAPPYEPTERYRMALQSILAVVDGRYNSDAGHAVKIALLALKGPPDAR